MPFANPLVIAHRGESRDAPENTLAAIGLAWERGAAAVEIDVRRSRDGDLVVIHDPDTRRIGGPRRAVGAQATIDLRALDAGHWKHPRWAGEKIPLLADVLAAVPRHGRLFVELKEGPECVPPLAAVLAAAGLSPRQVAIMSFNLGTVAAAAEAFRDREVLCLLAARQWTPAGRLAHWIERARSLGCPGLDLEIAPQLDADAVAAGHEAGLALYTWTVNRVATARRLAAAGIDGLTTDRCAWLSAQLRGLAAG